MLRGYLEEFGIAGNQNKMLLVIIKGKLMVITRQNPNGGPELKGYPIDVDPDTGVLGYKIGYCTCGCKNPLFIRSLDIQKVVNKFGYSLDEYEGTLARLKPKEPLRDRIIKFLGGKVQ